MQIESKVLSVLLRGTTLHIDYERKDRSLFLSFFPSANDHKCYFLPHFLNLRFFFPHRVINCATCFIDDFKEIHCFSSKRNIILCPHVSGILGEKDAFEVLICVPTTVTDVAGPKRTDEPPRRGVHL